MVPSGVQVDECGYGIETRFILLDYDGDNGDDDYGDDGRGTATKNPRTFRTTLPSRTDLRAQPPRDFGRRQRERADMGGLDLEDRRYCPCRWDACGPAALFTCFASATILMVLLAPYLEPPETYLLSLPDATPVRQAGASVVAPRKWRRRRHKSTTGAGGARRRKRLRWVGWRRRV